MGRDPDWKETLSLTCVGRHWVPTVQGFWQGRKGRRTMLRTHWNLILHNEIAFSLATKLSSCSPSPSLYPTHFSFYSLTLPPPLLSLTPSPPPTHTHSSSSSLTHTLPLLLHHLYITCGFPWPPPTANSPHLHGNHCPPNHVSKLHSYQSSCSCRPARRGHQSPAAPNSAGPVAGQPWNRPGWQGGRRQWRA